MFRAVNVKNSAAKNSFHAMSRITNKFAYTIANVVGAFYF